MSLGIYAVGRKNAEDDELVFYSYAGEDWDAFPTQKGDAKLQDGEIAIMKCCLEAPEIHRKIKRRKNGRKYICEKRICRLPDISIHLESSTIKILSPCKNEHHHYYAIHLLEKIFLEWQEKDMLPDIVTYFK